MLVTPMGTVDQNNMASNLGQLDSVIMSTKEDEIMAKQIRDKMNGLLINYRENARVELFSDVMSDITLKGLDYVEALDHLLSISTLFMPLMTAKLFEEATNKATVCGVFMKFLKNHENEERKNSFVLLFMENPRKAKHVPTLFCNYRGINCQEFLEPDQGQECDKLIKIFEHHLHKRHNRSKSLGAGTVKSPVTKSPIYGPCGMMSSNTNTANESGEKYPVQVSEDFEQESPGFQEPGVGNGQEGACAGSASPRTTAHYDDDSNRSGRNSTSSQDTGVFLPNHAKGCNSEQLILDMARSVLCKVGAEGPFCKLKVDKSHLVEDALNAIKALEKLDIPLQVQFHGDTRADKGNYCQEFSFLLVQKISQSKYLQGIEGHQTFSTHGDLDKFFLLGRLVAVTLLQGGCGLPVFGRTAADYILNGKFIKCGTPSLEEIPNEETRTSFKQIKGLKSEEELHTRREWLENNIPKTYKKTLDSISLQDRDDIQMHVIQHNAVQTCIQQIEEFCKGLSVLGVLELLRSQPDKFRKLFHRSELEPITVHYLMERCKYQYSNKGSKWLELEQMASANWEHFLEDVAGGDEDAQRAVTLTDVFQYLTGTRYIPAAGTPSILVSFQYGCALRQDQSSPCDCSLPDTSTSHCTFHLPLCRRLTSSDACTVGRYLAEAVSNGLNY